MSESLAGLARFLAGFFSFIAARYLAMQSTAGLRAAILPYHKFFGFVIWMGTMMAIATGIQDKMWIVDGFEAMKVFQNVQAPLNLTKYAYDESAWQYFFPNFIALSMLISFCGVVWALFYHRPAPMRPEATNYIPITPISGLDG